MARVEQRGDTVNRSNGIELDENASDESDFFLVHTGRGDSTIHKIRPAGFASAPGSGPPPREPPPPAPKNGSPSFSNAVCARTTRRMMRDHAGRPCTDCCGAMVPCQGNVLNGWAGPSTAFLVTEGYCGLHLTLKTGAQHA